MTTASEEARADIGVIGGTGFYAFLDDTVEVAVSTPYGPPSDPLVIGSVDGRRVAFVPRHGVDHRYPPHRIPYRANLWALRSVGVRQIVAPCAVGSLDPAIGPGAMVVPDQLVDRTSGRAQTYYDDRAVHVSFADPYCPTGRRAVLDTAAATGIDAIDGGALVVIEGPRFSTRAESQWYASAGWSLVGMTGHPEAVLARELAMCYTTLALVTDLDAGVTVGEGVTHEEVLRVFSANLATLRGFLLHVLPRLPAEQSCACGSALDGLDTGLTVP